MPSLTLGCCMVGVLLYLTNKSWSLSCEVCRLPMENCIGEKQMCFSFLDECATLQSKNYKSGKYISRKSCLQGNSCYGNLTTVDLGDRGIISSKMTCCHGKACSKSLPSFPTANKTLNGMKCKTCFAKEQTYCLWEETLQCKGDQTHCLILSGQADWGGFGTLLAHDEASSVVLFAMKGCVNPAFCELFHEGSVYFATLFLMAQGSCKPAYSKATMVPSHRVGFVFQAFAGFLLVEIYA